MSTPAPPATPGSLTPAGKEPRLQAPLAVWAFVLVLVAGAFGALYLQLASDVQVTVTVWVSRADLPAFHQLTTDDVELESVAADRAPRTAIRWRDQLVGRYTLTRVRGGEALRHERVGPIVRPGAIGRSLILGIEATRSATIGGRLERGVVADLLLAPRVSRRAQKPVTLRDVLVLDVIPAGSAVGGSTVVVAVDPAHERALQTLAQSVPTFIFPERPSPTG